VCYHNLLGVADYGSLGHGEVVGLQIPATPEAYKGFIDEYFSLFGKDLDRPDKVRIRIVLIAPSRVSRRLHPMVS